MKIMSYNVIFKLLGFKEKSIVSRKPISRKTFAVPFVTWLYENIFKDAYYEITCIFIKQSSYYGSNVKNGLKVKLSLLCNLQH